MADVCRLAADHLDADGASRWVGPDGIPSQAHRKRMVRWLKCHEKRVGVKVLFGGGRGVPFYTTERDLRESHFLDEPNIPARVDDAEAAIERIEENLNALVRELGAQKSSLAKHRRILVQLGMRSGVSTVGI